MTRYRKSFYTTEYATSVVPLPWGGVSNDDVAVSCKNHFVVPIDWNALV